MKTQKISFILICFMQFLCFSAPSVAQVLVEKLSSPTPVKILVPKTKGPNRNLVNQKRAENESRWNECLRLAPINLKNFPILKEWIYLSYLKCAEQQAQAIQSRIPLLKAVNSLDLEAGFKFQGPWEKLIQERVINSRFSLVQLSLKSDRKTAWQQIEKLLGNRSLLTENQMARAYQLAGELLQIQGDLNAARNFYQLSLNQAESSTARAQLNSVSFALNISTPENVDSAKNQIILSDEEQRWVERLKKSFDDGQAQALIDDCVQYLLKFPNGVRAKWANDKVVDTYLAIPQDRESAIIAGARSQALKIIFKSDATRLGDWARVMHRRNDFPSSLQLAELALQELINSPQSSVLLYVAGRSAQQLGEYSKAQKYFEKYIQQSSGATEIAEVHFRLALSFLRQGQASSAISAFEKLLSLKEKSQYELSAMYWLVRSLQATDNPRALKLTEEIQQKFPFSYYGLRLQMEKSAGLMSWPTSLSAPRKLASNHYLLTFQKQALNRMNILGEAGWQREAILESNEIPLPMDGDGQVLLAQKLHQYQVFPGVIKLINSAGDMDPQLRSLDIVQMSFPLQHKKHIENEASKNKISPFLIQSLIRQESAFATQAVSSSNAYGLMQLIGPTAQEVAAEIGLQNLSLPDQAFIPEINISMGSFYLAKMIKQFGGHVPLGLAAYNAGPGRMRSFVSARSEVKSQMEKHSSDPWDEMWFDELPWYETSFYVKAILRNSILYQLLEKSKEAQPDQRRVQFGSVLWADLAVKNKKESQ